MNRLCPFLALAGVLFVTACDDQLTSPRPGQRPSADIRDATHDGDNKEVFFLPPIVPNPSGSEFFKPGEFNPNLTSAVIRVCHMVTDPCTVVASFGAGQATGPIVISTSDEHYLALWHTDASNLVAGEPYRILVFPDADVTAPPVAWADVVVGNTGKDLKNVNTNEDIALVDGRTLPIKVRFQNGVRCESDDCLSERVTDEGGTLVLESGNAALVLPDGWLPDNIPEVTVTLERVTPGPNNDCVGKEGFTGPGLLVQREACLQVTTDPVIPACLDETGESCGPTTGIQRRGVFIFLCLEDPEDPFEPFLQVIKADAGRPLQALKDVPDDPLITQGFSPVCVNPSSDVSFGSHPLLRLASRGVRAITRPVARLLEVKSLYAIDLGQGGEIELFDGFSHFTLGVQASAAVFGTVPMSAPVGSVVALPVQVTGLTGHPGFEDPEPSVVSDGIPGVDVTFTITDLEPGGGLVLDPESRAGVNSLRLTTNEDGVATAYLLVGPQTNTVTAVAAVEGEAVPQMPPTVSFSIDGLIETSTTLTTSAPLAVVGEPVQLEATVSPAPAGAGSVEFFDGTTSLGTAALVPNGTASFTVQAFTLRAHTLSARFLGNSAHAPSSSATITQHTVLRYVTLAAFLAAVGDVSVQVQNFDALAGGTPITSIIPAVLSVNSPFPVLDVTSCSGSLALFGSSSETFNPRTTPTEFGFNSFYDLLFNSTVAPRNALAFDITSQDPASQPAVLEITGITTPTARFFVSNTSSSESTPVFVGMIASEPLNRVIVNEGREANNFPGNEEICLDNFRIASVATP